MPQLIVHYLKEDRHHTIDIPPRSAMRVTVGREDTNNVVLGESWASRHHLTVYPSGSQLGVDITGRNGIRLENGQVVRPDDNGPAQCFFSNGEKFFLGPEYVFEVADGAEEPTIAVSAIEPRVDFTPSQSSEAVRHTEDEETELEGNLNAVRDRALERLREQRGDSREVDPLETLAAPPEPPAAKAPAAPPPRMASPPKSAVAPPPVVSEPEAKRLAPTPAPSMPRDDDREAIAANAPQKNGGGMSGPEWTPRPSRNLAGEALRAQGELLSKTLDWLKKEKIDAFELESVDHAGEIARFVASIIDQVLSGPAYEPHRELWVSTELAAWRRRTRLAGVYSAEADKRSPGRLLGMTSEEDDIAEALSSASDPEHLKMRLTSRQTAFLWKRHLVRTVMDVLYGVGGLEEVLTDPSVREVRLRGPLEAAEVLHETKSRFDVWVAPVAVGYGLVVRRLLALGGWTAAAAEASADRPLKLPRGVRMVVLGDPSTVAKSPEDAELVLRIVPAAPLNAPHLGTDHPGLVALLQAAVETGWGIIIEGNSGDGRTAIARTIQHSAAKLPGRTVTIERGDAELRALGVDDIRFDRQRDGRAGSFAQRQARALRPDLIIVDDLIESAPTPWGEWDSTHATVVLAMDRGEFGRRTTPDGRRPWLLLRLGDAARLPRPSIQEAAVAESGRWTPFLRYMRTTGRLMPTGACPEQIAALIADGRLNPSVFAATPLR